MCSYMYIVLFLPMQLLLQCLTYFSSQISIGYKRSNIVNITNGAFSIPSDPTRFTTIFITVDGIGNTLNFLQVSFLSLSAL